MIEYTVRVFDDRTEWLLNDEWHREDGPALEYTDGHNAWFLNGKRHREDGPAIECANGSKAWWLNGKQLTEDEFNAKTNTQELTVAEISELLGYDIKVVK